MSATSTIAAQVAMKMLHKLHKLLSLSMAARLKN